MGSPDYLSQLVDQIPENSPKPTEEHVRTIITLDEAVRGRGTMLRKWLERLEYQAKHDENGWNMARYESFRNSSQAELDHEQFLGKRRTTNMEWFEAEHERRLASLKTALPNSAIEDGGLKSEARTEAKLKHQEKIGRTPTVTDFSRARIICDGLKDMGSTYFALFHEWKLTYDLLGSINYYSDSATKYPTPFRSINTYWITEEKPETPNMNTEIQLVTKNVRALLDLNHSFDIAKTAEYPNKKLRAWVQRLFYKASIVDFKELFGI